MKILMMTSVSDKVTGPAKTIIYYLCCLLPVLIIEGNAKSQLVVVKIKMNFFHVNLKAL